MVGSALFCDSAPRGPPPFGRSDCERHTPPCMTRNEFYGLAIVLGGLALWGAGGWIVMEGLSWSALFVALVGLWPALLALPAAWRALWDWWDVRRAMRRFSL